MVRSAVSAASFTGAALRAPYDAPAPAPARSLLRRRRMRSSARAGPLTATTCNSSVDLPTPGSPPTKMAEPGTTPPPHTRSNSSMPVIKPIRRRCLDVKGLELQPGAGAGRFGWSQRARRTRTRNLLDERIPSMTGRTLARPFGVDRAAGLTNVKCAVAGHDFLETLGRGSNWVLDLCAESAPM